MEEKKLGMGWYEFLRYFTYGFGRIVIAALALLYGLASFREPSLIILFLIYSIDFVLTFVMHRHLENYSSRTVSMFTVVLIFNLILDAVLILADGGTALYRC